VTFRRDIIARMNGVTQSVPHEHFENAQAVRAYRNTVVHGGKDKRVSLPQADDWLCKFFSWMPPKW
jgi:hypothetical protein